MKASVLLWSATGDATRQVRVTLGGTCADAHSDVTVTEVGVQIADGPAVADASFTIAGLIIPNALLAPAARPAEAADPQNFRLLSPIDAIEGKRAALLAQIEQQIADLRAALLKLQGPSAGGSFLGATTVAGAQLSYTACIRLDRLFTKAAAGPVLLVSATADLEKFMVPWKDATTTIAAQVRLDFALEVDGAATLLPEIRVPTLPDLSVAWGTPLALAQDAALKLDAFFDFSRDAQAAERMLGGLFRRAIPPGLITVVANDTPRLSAELRNGDFAIKTLTPGSFRVRLGGSSGPVMVEFTQVEFTLEARTFSLEAQVEAGQAMTTTLPPSELPEVMTGPYLVTIGPTVLNGVAHWGTAALDFQLTANIQRIEIRARSKPSLVLAVSLALQVERGADGQVSIRPTEFQVLDPTLGRIKAALQRLQDEEQQALWSLVCALDTAAAQAMDAMEALVQRLFDLAAAAAAWLQTQEEAAIRGVTGIADGMLQLLGNLGDAVRGAIHNGAMQDVAFEVRIDLERLRIARLVVASTKPFDASKIRPMQALGMQLLFAGKLVPGLVCDFAQGWGALVLALPPEPPASPPQDPRLNASATLSTDLWLDNPSASGQRVTGTSDTPAANESPILSVGIQPDRAQAQVTYMALAMLRQGKASFLVDLGNAATRANMDGTDGRNHVVVVNRDSPFLGADIQPVSSANAPHLQVTPQINTDRLLSLFKLPALDGGSGQYIKVKQVGQPHAVGGDWWRISVPVTVELQVPGFGGPGASRIDTTLELVVDLRTFKVDVRGGAVDIKLPAPPPNSEGTVLSLLGLDAVIKPRIPTRDPFLAFQLDLNDGNPCLRLSEKTATLQLFYRDLSSGGRPLGFDIGHLAIAASGIDLKATVGNDPVQLAGVDMPFRFDHGELNVVQSRIQALSLAGHGNLPPALVGEAKASILLNFGASDHHLTLLSCDAQLDLGKDPIRCDNTRFTVVIEKLGLRFVQQDGYHFYFTVTGSAQFKPIGSEFSSGLLRNLSNLKIVLHEAPLASDPSVLMQHVEFLVPVDPPDKTSFFDLFQFELRGFGFVPASPAFDNAPAICISGQVNFTESFDVVTPRFDFHKLWIAPPKKGDVLPRIRLDGLGVGLSIGPGIDVRAMGMAIDGTLPTIDKTGLPAKPVTGKGFVAEGSLRVKGFASLAASMGFVELEKAGQPGKRLAFFLYVQEADISVPIETPIGTYYIRTIGAGFGYRYTLAGMAAADQATTPKQLVSLLDGISKYQGNLDQVTAWAAEYDSDAVTLALRALFTMASLRQDVQTSYDPEEDDLANWVLFDVLAALRTDLTFLMNVRAWIAYNYGDWRKGEGRESWQQNPTLTGYLYLSAPRHEFLMRAVYNPGAEIGKHPDLNKELKSALQSLHWTSTLYVRPGLFHQEFGWPYELGFDLNKPGSDFWMTVRGGTVLRYEDNALLYGIAFLANGAVSFKADTGGDFGASVAGRANFTLGAKLIAYIALESRDTMLYGTVSLDVTVSFSVHMWLNARFFSLSASFSVSVTIHVSAELLLAPAGMAAQIQASVSVGAFGRSLTLGIGFGIGDRHALDQARARTNRYLALGLGSSYPDPTAGLSAGGSGTQAAAAVAQPPLPEPSRQASAERASERVTGQAQQSQRANPDPANAAAEPVQGLEFERSDFWMLLFPIPAASGTGEDYLVQFVPRETQPAGHPANFYAAPPSDGGDRPEYVVQFQFAVPAADAPALPADWLVQLPPQRAQNPVPPDANHAFSCFTDWDSSIGTPSSDSRGRVNPDLRELFEGACFVATPDKGKFAIGNIPSFGEPRTEDLPDDAKARNDVLASAARSRALLGPKLRRFLAVEEARSTFVATIGRGAAQLAMRAQSGTDGLPSPENLRDLDIDPRCLGLTFRLRGQYLGAFLAATFSVQTRRPVARGAPALSPISGTAIAFNPPPLMFRAAPPRLANRRWQLRQGAVHLHWDLVAAWSAEAEADHDPTLAARLDPRLHLQHYRVERHAVYKAAATSRRLPPRKFTVTQSSPLTFDAVEPDGLDGGVSYLQVTRHTHALQLVDDFLDLPGEIASAIFPTADTWATPDVAQSPTLALQYLILPVDSANTSHVPIPWSIDLKAPALASPGVTLAVARFAYEYAPVSAGGTGNPAAPAHRQFAPEAFPPESRGTFLSFQLTEPATAPDTTSGPDPRRAPQLVRKDAPDYELRIRRDRLVAGGTFGADALTQAKSAPPAPAADQSLASNEAVVLLRLLASGAVAPTPLQQVMVQRIAQTIAGWGTPDQDTQPLAYHLTPQDPATLDTATLLDMLGCAVLDSGSDDRHATRLYIRPKADPGGAPLPWTAVHLQLRIGIDRTNAEGQVSRAYPVEAAVECFEQPIALSFQALQCPLVTECGRLYLAQPAVGATLGNFGTDGQLFMQQDAARRTGVRVAWEARPKDLAVVSGEAYGPKLQPLVGGFDVFAMDVTGVPRLARTADAADPEWLRWLARAERVARVQKLPESEIGQDPTDSGDLARIETWYPSEAPGAPPVRLSAGESFLQWPFSPALLPGQTSGRLTRRSLCTLPEDHQVEALFAQGLPTTLLLSDSTSVPLHDRLAPRVCINALESALPGLKAPTVTDDKLRIEMQGNVSFQVDDVRRLILHLSLAGTAVQNLPSSFALEGQRAVGENVVSTGTAMLRTSPPATSRHALLADVLDLLRYRNLAAKVTGGALVYRAYEVLVEAAPPLRARDLRSLLDATMPDHDPSGWGLLRSLGLACSWRLYDIDAGRFLDCQDALAQLKDTLAVVLPRYCSVTDGGADLLGKPIVDVLGTPDTLGQLVPFDGAPVDERHISQTDRLLGLVQLELRPFARPLASASAPGQTAVRYGRLLRRLDLGADPDQLGTTPHEIRSTLFQAGMLAEIELKPAGGHERMDTVLLLGSQPAGSQPGEAAAQAPPAPAGPRRFPWDGTDTLVESVSFTPDLPNADEPALVGWVRLLKPRENWLEPLFAPLALRDGSTIVFEEDTAQDVVHEVPAQQPRAWGRFGPLPARWISRLLFGDNDHDDKSVSEDPDATPPTDYPMATAPIITGVLEPLLAAISAAAQVAQGAAATLPKSGKDRLDVAQRIGTWSQRFLDKGIVPPIQPVTAAHATALSADQLPIALAMLAPPTTRRVAASAGRLSALLFEKDRYGKIRKYAVRPFGRYESLQIAALSSPDGAPSSDPHERREWMALTRPSLAEPGVFGPSAPGQDNFLVSRFADAVIERSQPISPPVILAMRAQDALPAASGQALPSVEIFIARHPDEALAESNVATDAGLAMRHVGVGFFRRFRDQDWCDRLRRDFADIDAPLDPEAPFGPFAPPVPATAVLPAPDALVIRDADGKLAPGPIRSAYRLLPDLFTGAHVLRVANMPYGFRLYATAHAAAGCVVSDTVATAIDGARCVFSLPWRDPKFLPDGSAMPRRGYLPEFAIQPVGTRDTLIQIRVTWPLVRYLDGMPVPTRELWFGHQESVPAIFRAPDAAVGYRLGVATPGNLEIDGHAEFHASRKALDPTGFVVHSFGKRFRETTSLELKAPKASDGQYPFWRATTTLEFVGTGAEIPKLPELVGLPDSAAINGFPLAVPSELERWQTWGLLAPEASVSIRITPPPQADTAAWQTLSAALRRLVTSSLVDPGAKEPGKARVCKKFAQRMEILTDYVQPVNGLNYGNWPGPKLHGVPVAVDLELATLWGMPMPGTPLQSAAPLSWTWPSLKPTTDLDVETFMRSEARRSVGEILENQAGVAGLVTAAMRTWMIAYRHWVDEQPIAGVPAGTIDQLLATPLADGAIGWKGDLPAARLLLLVDLTLAAGMNEAAFESVFARLEVMPDGAPALEALTAMLTHASTQARLPVPWAAGTDWQQSFRDLTAARSELAGGRCVLRAPLAQSICEDLEAFSELSGLGDRLARASADMLFGNGRSLVLEAFTGTQPALVTKMTEVPPP